MTVLKRVVKNRYKIQKDEMRVIAGDVYRIDSQMFIL